ncbi:MAG: hydrogenase expression/formation protein [Candidatus Scalindua sp.]|jgi:hydrogenase maturation factor|nr:hydrogenase expression/formation protein [Candidatus Scalindua sp.]MBT5307642.1 hydrogenase expression/formation protein [Candidatus Scalindua sp.]MBT6050653.1 hydrogenase expression/formation protein [Candidatus Scalindua sp.]MBT6228361.1 hydrogenase expression/formation protein [Candidatus Scalindua sp.]MBT6561973.1 hydrogenase expression/formation protein [Candidatus Scalindua sp.]
MNTFRVGKLNTNLLDELISSIKKKDPRVIVGPKVGEDAAVIDFGDKYLISTTDPITFTSNRIGWYMVNVNANDIAAMGGTPKWLLSSIFLPENKTDRVLVKEIFYDIEKAADELGIAICGGHTEITKGLDRPIVSGHMLGEVDKNKLVTNSHARVGDEIILTKGIAIEGMALLAREREKELTAKYGNLFVERVQNFLHNPGISVVAEALIANQTADIRAMHDPTEGGLATGLFELARAANTGVLIYEENIRYLEEARILCSEYNLDPLGVIASGALLIVVVPEDRETVLSKLVQNDIECSVIGKLTDKEDGLKIIVDGETRELPFFEADEITKVI